MNADDLLVGVIAVDLGLTTQERLDVCLRDRAGRLDAKPIAEALVAPEHLARLLEEQKRRFDEMADARRFGQIALAKGFVTAAQLADALRDQMKSPAALLGETLLARGHLTRGKFRDAVEAQGAVLYECPSCRAYSALPAAQSVAQARCPRCGQMLALVMDSDERGSTSSVGHSTTAEFKAPLASLGKFQIHGEIARGSMGIVFKAHDSTLDRTVALKVLKEGDSNVGFIRRLHREASLAAKLRHENIVTVHEVGEIEGLHYLCMDFIEGQELVDFIRKRRLPPAKWLRLIEKVARGVHYAHTQGIIHRDLKPSNILVDAKGVPFIMDFGLAKQLDDAAWLTKEGTAMGTPYYMPPEQVLGRLDRIDQRSDVYSLGVIIYEIITGTPPFTGQTALEIYQKTLTEEPPRPGSLVPALDADVEAICLKAMEKEREHRYSTAEDLAFDIGRHLAGEPIMARRATPMRAAARRLRKHGWKAASLAAAVLLTLLAVAAVGRVGRGREIAALEREAQGHYDAQRWEEALDACKRIVERAPGHASANQRIGELKLRLEQTQRTEVRTAVDREKEERRKRLEAAKPFFMAGTAKMEDARTLMHQEPYDARAVHDRLDEAIAQFTEAIQRDSEYADALFLRGRCHVDNGDSDSAEKDFSRVVELTPNNPAALLERGRIHFVLAVQGLHGRFGPDGRSVELSFETTTPEAKEHKRRAMEDFSRATDRAAPEDRFLMKAYMDLAEGDYLEAVANFTRTLAQNEVNTDATFGRGFCHLLRGEHDLAIVELKRTIRLKPNQYAAWTMMGIAHSAKGELEAAVPCFRRAVDAGDGNATNNLASVLAFLGRYDEALEVYELLRRKRVPQQGVEMGRASVLYAKGDLPATIAAAEKMIERWPELAEPYELAAICYARTGSKDVARSYLRKSIELDPKNASALSNYASMLFDDDNTQEAWDLATRALELDPSNAQAHMVRGAVRASRSQYEAALAEFDRAVAADPKDVRAHLNRAMALVELKRWDEARAGAEKARGLDPEAGRRADRILDEIKKRKGE